MLKIGLRPVIQLEGKRSRIASGEFPRPKELTTESSEIRVYPQPGRNC